MYIYIYIYIHIIYIYIYTYIWDFMGFSWNPTVFAQTMRW